MKPAIILAVFLGVACACPVGEAQSESAASSAHDELTQLVTQDAKQQWSVRKPLPPTTAAAPASDVVQMDPFWVTVPVVRLSKQKYETPFMRLLRTGTFWKDIGHKTTSQVQMSFDVNRHGFTRTQIGYEIKW